MSGVAIDGGIGDLRVGVRNGQDGRERGGGESGVSDLHESLLHYFSLTLGIGKVAVTTRVSPCVFTRAPVSQK